MFDLSQIFGEKTRILRFPKINVNSLWQFIEVLSHAHWCCFWKFRTVSFASRIAAGVESRIHFLYKDYIVSDSKLFGSILWIIHKHDAASECWYRYIPVSMSCYPISCCRWMTAFYYARLLTGQSLVNTDRSVVDENENQDNKKKYKKTSTTIRTVTTLFSERI